MIKRVLFLFLSISLVVSCTTDGGDSGGSGGNGIDKSANLKTTGSSAQALLSDVKFTSINIEMVYVEGHKPTDAAISSFKNFLSDRVYKPDGIEITLRSEASSGLAPFDNDDIVKVEKDTRTAYNAGDEIAVWIYFADGKNENDTNDKVTLGSAFRNTSIIIYKKTIREFANRSSTVDEATIEAATLNHEFGHLFGLVDLGTTPVSSHEDPDNQGHCNVEKCLMRASLEFGSGTIDILTGEGIPELDQACIDDLQSVGGK